MTDMPSVYTRLLDKFEVEIGISAGRTAQTYKPKSNLCQHEGLLAYLKSILFFFSRSRWSTRPRGERDDACIGSLHSHLSLTLMPCTQTMASPDFSCADACTTDHFFLQDLSITNQSVYFLLLGEVVSCKCCLMKQCCVMGVAEIISKLSRLTHLLKRLD